MPKNTISLSFFKEALIKTVFWAERIGDLKPRR